MTEIRTPLFDSFDAFRRLDVAGVCKKNGLLYVPGDVLTRIAFEAFGDASFFLRATQLQTWRDILDDAESSPNDRFAALSFLKNACVSCKRVLPLCQDTGTATVFGEKGHRVLTDGNDAEALSAGIRQAYAQYNLRYSQNAALSFFNEKNTGDNLPAAVELAAVKGDEYRFLFVAKGGGSANKTFLFQQTRALLEKKALTAFLAEKIAQIGTSACPPYRLAVVVGGLSAEQCLHAVKLACAGALDGLPAHGNENGDAFRDADMEAVVKTVANATGFGAQFGGKHFCSSVRCVRLPRHGASLPVGIGVSCAADRNVLARVTKDGAFLERLEERPERFLPDERTVSVFDGAKKIDLDGSAESALKQLHGCAVGEKVLLSGTMTVARDQAHARFKAKIDAGEPLPDYVKKYPIYYAGPAKTPAGLPCGSLGPTTAGRMDDYTEVLQSVGASLIMVGKGMRSKKVAESCKKYGGFYLGALGGAAALTTAAHITSCTCIDYADLGMEAVYRLHVENFPAVVLIDDAGHDFYDTVLKSKRPF